MAVITRTKKDRKGQRTKTKSEDTLTGTALLCSSIARHFPDGIIGVLDKNLRYLFAGGTEIDRLGMDPARPRPRAR